MALNLVTLLSTTAKLLSDNNTSTSSYNISNNLKKQVGNFYIGVEGMHEKCPVPVELYPVVFVELGGLQEPMKRLGNSANRDIEFNMHFVGITNYGAGSGGETAGRQNASLECITLMQNIQYLLRNKIDLSGTVDVCTVDNVRYGINRDGTYTMIGDINAKILITDSD